MSAQPELIERPKYSVDAVDNTLVLLQILWRDEAVRLSDVARELGVARSTAHRLLRMLVFRGFATQREDRCYLAGPALSRSRTRNDHDRLVSRLHPAAQHVADTLGETVHLVVREGTRVVFIDSIEGRQPLRIGSRLGVQLPAETSSGGRVLLAHLSPVAVHALYAHCPRHEVERLDRLLAQTRQRRYGLNVDETERGIAAVGVAVPESDGAPFAAIVHSAPTIRFQRAWAPEIAQALHGALARFDSLAPPG